MINWLKRRWFDFRNGHGTYLIFFIQFIQFVIVSYQLYIINTEAQIFLPTIYHWIGFFVATYIPTATLAGHIHRKKQMATDQEQQVGVNPLTFRTVVQDGKEVLYTLRLNRISYDYQLKAMRIHNQTADAFKQVFGIVVDKWTENEFRQIEANKEMTRRLETGDDIRDIAFKEYELDKDRG